MKARRGILVIDDDPRVGAFVAAAAEMRGLLCTVTTDAASFLSALEQDPRLILVDLLMPNVDGIEVLRLLSEQRCTAGIVLMSELDKRVLDTAEQLASVLGLSIVGRLRKPLGSEMLLPILQWCEDASIPPDQRSWAQPSMDNASFEAIIPDGDLWSAVERNEFVLHFQPQIDFATKKVCGIEALVRWVHPKYGMILPDHFIGRAESLFVIDEIGWIVLRQGLAVQKRFRNAEGELLRLSFNVSAVSLRDLDFPDKVSLMLKECEIPPAKVALEVTESGVVQYLSHTLDVLTRLRMKGLKLAIDDFGTGYSMLQQLKRIPANELKIDRTFIHSMLTNQGDRILVQKTIEIGHETGMAVIAEGVETEEQYEWLRGIRCNSAQGYLFSPALPAEEMVTWLTRYQTTQSA